MAYHEFTVQPSSTGGEDTAIISVTCIRECGTNYDIEIGFSEVENNVGLLNLLDGDLDEECPLTCPSCEAHKSEQESFCEDCICIGCRTEEHEQIIWNDENYCSECYEKRTCGDCEIEMTEQEFDTNGNVRMCFQCEANMVTGSR